MTTLNPIQLINPTGSGTGQQILSSGPGTAPYWGNMAMSNEIFPAPSKFTPGTTISLTLAGTYGSVANIWVYFDASYQGPDQIASLVGNVLTFTSAIPVGVTNVYIKGGIVVSSNVPSAASITLPTLGSDVVSYFGKQSDVTALLAGQGSGVIGYATLAAMNADLAHAAGSVAYVTNDTTLANNTIYIKIGASGAGSWQVSALTPAQISAGVIQAIFPSSANLLNINALTANTALTVADGTTTPAGGWYTSDYMPVAASTVYNAANGTFPALVLVQYCFYTASKVYISGNSASSFTSPSNAAYARIATMVLNSVTFQFSAGSSAPSSYVSFGKVLTIGDTNYPLTIPESAIDSALQNMPSGTVKPSMIKSVVQSANLLNSTALDVVLGSFIQPSSGFVVGNAAYNASGFILVTGGASYAATIGSPLPVAGAPLGAWYDVNKTYISGVGLASGITTAPLNAAYVRISTVLASWTTMMFAAGSSLPTLYVVFSWVITNTDPIYPLTVAKSAISAALQTAGSDIAAGLASTVGSVDVAQAKFLSIGQNLFSRNTVNLGYSVDASTGVLNQSGGTWCATDFVPVLPSTAYLISQNVPPKAYSPVFGAWYNANKVYISATAISAGSMTSPANAAFVRLSNTTSDNFTTLMVVQGSTIPAFFKPYGWEFDSNRVNVIDSRIDTTFLHWKGKNLMTLGDSMTLQAVYIPKLCATTGLNYNNVVNLGVNGQVLRTMADNITSGNIAGIDIITWFGGTNDYGHGNDTLGAITDDKSMNTIYGSIYYVLDKIFTLSPNVRVVFFPSPWRGAYSTEPVPPAANSNGLTLANIATATVQACGQLGVPALDIYRVSGINSYNFASYLIDNLHPNQVGADLIGRLMGQFINTQV